MNIKGREYPDDWPEISYRIKEREGWHCGWCNTQHGQPHYKTGSMVILTVHHLGAPRPDHSPGDMHDKLDCRDENLVALCQRCHLWADRVGHRLRAAQTRRRRKLEAGQMEML